MSACVVVALQTVGAILVISMVITPGATAYLLTDDFKKMLIISTILGVITSATGAYLSYHLNVTTGGLIVVFQAFLFLLAFYFAPKHGYFAKHKKLKLELTNE